MAKEPDLDALAEQYLDLWQEQVSALATDAGYAGFMGQMLKFAGMVWTGPPAGHEERDTDGGPSRPEQADQRRRTDSAARSPAPAAASRAGGDDVAELTRRIAALEKRIAELEADAGRPGSGSARRARRDSG